MKEFAREWVQQGRSSPSPNGARAAGFCKPVRYSHPGVAQAQTGAQQKCPRAKLLGKTNCVYASKRSPHCAENPRSHSRRAYDSSTARSALTANFFTKAARESPTAAFGIDTPQASTLLPSLT